VMFTVTRHIEAELIVGFPIRGSDLVAVESPLPVAQPRMLIYGASNYRLTQRRLCQHVAATQTAFE
ncbi:unnamed protein product, partial [Prorocentrum cordatum]